MSRPFKRLLQIAEAAFIAVLYVLLRILPMPVASFIGGKLARCIGRFLKPHRTALRNLEDVFPDYPAKIRRAIALDMWENLGRTSAEFPHVPNLKEGKRLEILGKEHITAAFNSPRPHVFVSAHIGNWETMPKSVSLHGQKSPLVYRHANNPFAEWLIQYIRRSYQSRGISKTAGVRALVQALRAGENIGMLIDQKMNTGVPVPFFGRDAMTAPAAATAALRYNAVLLPIRAERLGGCRMRVTVYPPIEFIPTGDTDADTNALLLRIHHIFEEWIRARPGQWLWAHNRWPKSKPASN